MDTKLCFLLLAVLAIAHAKVRVEWSTLDGRRADNCVNEQSKEIFTLRADCLAGTYEPPASNMYLIPSVNSHVARRYNNEVLTISGRLFPNSAAILGLSRRDSQTCADVDPALATATVTFVSATTLTFSVPANWMTGDREIELGGRLLCYNTDGVAGNYQWTGFRIGTVWNCDDNSDISAQRCSQRTTAALHNEALKIAVEQGRTTCCPSTVQRSLRVSQCINPRVESCCGSSVVGPLTKCCNATTEAVAYIDGSCKCRRSSQATDCPNFEQCCLPSKYPELTTSTDAVVTAAINEQVGECFNPDYSRCCDTGKKYDPGSDQCCSINGIQSLNIPCPCGADSDCQGGQLGLSLTDMMCCLQTAPVPQEINANAAQSLKCNRYQNFPSGQGQAQVQHCLGQCLDSRYQICCNGATCRKQFEKCCNNTCCNMFTGTCAPAFRSGSDSPFNWHRYHLQFDVCTTIEQLNPVNVFWVFVLPTSLLAATLGGLALALVFASRLEHRQRRGLEKAMILFGLISIIFATPCFFAPVYKYGVVLVFTGLFAIITSAARKVGMYSTCIILQLVLILYLWDPFNGNDYLNFASDRISQDNGRTDPRASGVLHAISTIYRQPETCASFYDYFRLDPLLRDTLRFDQPEITTFGYCSRGWVVALLVFTSIAMVAVVIQLFLSILALLIRGGYLAKQATASSWEN